MNKWAMTFAAAVAACQPTFAFAERWAPLGGSGNSELDLDSVDNSVPPSAWIRTSGQTVQGVLTTYFNIVAYCEEDYLYIQDGEIATSWSSMVAPMPDMPDADRVVAIPVPNAALNNAFYFLCKRR
ncbi:MAG: hypothetical protein V4586_20415 [Pseudomonadota bacterium]